MTAVYNERRFRFLMWRWTRKLNRKGDITDEQAQNILHNLRENPATDGESFLEELQTSIVLIVPVGLGMGLIEVSETILQAEGLLSDIFSWLLDHWEQILEIVLFLISIF